MRLVKTYNNRRCCQKHFCLRGRNWTRRVRWYETDDGLVILKMEDRLVESQVVATQRAADIIYQRFWEGQPIDDCISILARRIK